MPCSTATGAVPKWRGATEGGRRPRRGAKFSKMGRKRPLRLVAHCLANSKSRYDPDATLWANLQMWQAPGPRAGGAGWEKSMMIASVEGLMIDGVECLLEEKRRVLSVKNHVEDGN